MEEVYPVVPRAHPSRTLLYAYFNRSGSKGTFSLPGATWDRFRCTVEPSPGHIGCRVSLHMDREVLHGVDADGVGVKFPIFAVNCCCLPLSFRRSREKRSKRGKMRRKRGKMRRKRGKVRKKGENHSDPIYTNPIKNLPNGHGTSKVGVRSFVEGTLGNAGAALPTLCAAFATPSLLANVILLAGRLSLVRSDQIPGTLRLAIFENP